MKSIANDIAIAVLFMITGWMLRTFLVHQHTMNQLSMTTKRLASSDQRLERVEHAIDSVAIEVEGIIEGQRFVTKLIAERASILAHAAELTVSYPVA